MSRTKRDSTQISQFEHDEELDAKRVRVVGTEIAISVDADDGDSVAVQPRVFEWSLTNDSPIDITVCKEIKIYGSGAITLEICPTVSGSTWLTVGNYTDSSPIVPVLARRARIISANPVVVIGRGL